MPGRGDGFVVLCPLSLEARCVRRGLPEGVSADHVVHAGVKARRAADVVAALRRHPAAPVAVVGVACGLTAGARPGDLVVADEVRSERGLHRCTAAPVLASALASAEEERGRAPVAEARTVLCGPIRQSERVAWRVAVSGEALALDLESASLLDLVERAGGPRPSVVVRAVVDTPARPLASLVTVPGGIAALSALTTVGPALRTWASAAAVARRPRNGSGVKEVRHR